MTPVYCCGLSFSRPRVLSVCRPSARFQMLARLRWWGPTAEPYRKRRTGIRVQKASESCLRWKFCVSLVSSWRYVSTQPHSSMFKYEWHVCHHFNFRCTRYPRLTTVSAQRFESTNKRTVLPFTSPVCFIFFNNQVRLQLIGVYRCCFSAGHVHGVELRCGMCLSFATHCRTLVSTLIMSPTAA